MLTSIKYETKNMIIEKRLAFVDTGLILISRGTFPIAIGKLPSATRLFPVATILFPVEARKAFASIGQMVKLLKINHLTKNG